jgi:hypothetical protein
MYDEETDMDTALAIGLYDVTEGMASDGGGEQPKLLAFLAEVPGGSWPSATTPPYDELRTWRETAGLYGLDESSLAALESATDADLKRAAKAVLFTGNGQGEFLDDEVFEHPMFRIAEAIRNIADTLGTDEADDGNDFLRVVAGEEGAECASGSRGEIIRDLRKGEGEGFAMDPEDPELRAAVAAATDEEIAEVARAILDAKKFEDSNGDDDDEDDEEEEGEDFDI